MAKRSGRRRGSRNRGYWFRSGRGWYVTTGSGYEKLCDEHGQHLRDPDAAEEARRAHARHLLTHRPAVPSDSITLLEICNHYLEHANRTGSASTYTLRSRLLFDFCTGRPGRSRSKVHEGYGLLPLNSLTRRHVAEWIQAHPQWRDGGRMAIRALMRAINYAVQQGLTVANPVRGALQNVPPPRSRVTYLSEETEQSLCAVSSEAFATAVRVCIATGARPLCEFAALEARHVVETSRGQQWRFPRHESKIRTKERVVFVPSGVAEIVRKLVSQHPTGKLFRSPGGTAWSRQKLQRSFARAKAKVQQRGIELDQDACFYSCRHTFAKRKLAAGVSLETIAGLMGNTPKICWQSYARWADVYLDPLWRAAEQ